MEKYSLNMRVMHWVVGVMIVTLLAVGFYMADLDKTLPNKYDLYPMHKSFGMIVLLLVLIRLPLRVVSKVPALPKQITPGAKFMSAVVIGLLYVCMLLQPLSGYFMSVLGGREVAIFDWKLPQIFAENKELAGIAYETHEVVGVVLVALISLHILGWLKHLFIDKVNLYRRMW